MLSDYTDPTTVRALLGVNDLEIEDGQFLLPAYELVIESGLDNLSVNVAPLYAVIAALPVNTRTISQTRFYNSVRLYSGLLVAKDLLPTLPMAAPRKIADEKAALERIADPYKLLEANLTQTLQTLAKRILATLAVLDPTKAVTGVTRRFASSVGLVLDPVTGV